MIGPNHPMVEARFANWTSQVIGIMAPTHLQVIGGRGTSKTTQIHAERFQEAMTEMPRSLMMFLCNTFENARTNLVPGLQIGWREFRDWKYGVDYVFGEPPPKFFEKCYVPVENYKNMITHRNGACVVVGSAAMASGLAGSSYQYMGADEVKFIGKKKMDIILPALRGYNMFPQSAYYLGTTFTTDLPNMAKLDDPWVLEYRSKSDVHRAKAAFYTGYAYYQNELKLAKALEKKNKEAIKKGIRARARLYTDWLRCRKDLSFYLVTSSFANVDVLTVRYMKNLMETLGWEEFKQSVLSIRGGVEEGEKFYQGLQEDHFFRDGIDEDYDQSLGLHEKASCLILRHLDPFAEIDAGVDFGRMLSMVVAQVQGDTLRCLKGMHVLAPESSRALADKFVEFFAPHKKKVLNLYYDRSGNQYESSGRDWASEIKNTIEIDALGSRTGWQVNLMSRGQATIYQSEEFRLMKNVLGETIKGLPKLMIDIFQCRELKSSMELARIKIHQDRKTGKKTIHKNKSSEKLPLRQLPLNSTNYSDAFKYLMYRREWADLLKGRSYGSAAAMDG